MASRPSGGSNVIKPSFLSFQLVLADHGTSRTESSSTRSIPVVHGGEKILGHVKIVMLGQLNFKIDTAFEGLIRTWIGEDAKNPLEPHDAHLHDLAEFKILDQNQRLSSKAAEVEREGNLHTFRIPFCFVVPHNLVSPRDDFASEFLSLSPSAKIGPTYTEPRSGRTFGQPNITYAVKIKRIFTDMPLQISVPWRLEQEITVIPYAAATPSVQLCQSSHDYRTHVSISLRKHCLMYPFGVLRVAGPNNILLNMSTAEPKASTVVNLDLEFESTRAHVHGPACIAPDDWLFRVRYHVRSRTFFSTRILEAVPTSRAVQADADLRVQDRKTMLVHREAMSISWNHDCDSLPRSPTRRPPGSAASDRDGFSESESNKNKRCRWTSVLTIPITVTKTLLPTFQNCLSARRYAVILRLGIKGLSHRAIELVLPVQVIYCPAEDASTEWRRNIDSRIERHDMLNEPVDVEEYFHRNSDPWGDGDPPTYEVSLGICQHIN